MVYVWKVPDPVQFVSNLFLPGGFELHSYLDGNCNVKTATGKTEIHQPTHFVFSETKYQGQQTNCSSHSLFKILARVNDERLNSLMRARERKERERKRENERMARQDGLSGRIIQISILNLYRLDIILLCYCSLA